MTLPYCGQTGKEYIIHAVVIAELRNMINILATCDYNFKGMSRNFIRPIFNLVTYNNELCWQVINNVVYNADQYYYKKEHRLCLKLPRELDIYCPIGDTIPFIQEEFKKALMDLQNV